MAEVKVQSVSAALEKASREQNKYLQKWGDDDWISALLTVYLGGGMSMLAEMQNAPYRWKRLLLDAHDYQMAELELLIASATSSANMEKKDRKNYFDNLRKRLRGERD